jgi:hypothetical protein
MDDGRADLALDVVADDGQAGVLEFFRPFRIGGEEDGHAIHHRDARRQAGFRIVLHRLFGADGQVAQQHFCARPAQSLSDIGRLQIGWAKGDVVAVVRHMRRHAVELGTHLDDHIRYRQRTLEDTRIVRLGEDRLLERPADLALVDVECGDEFDVAGPVAADGLVHHAIERRVAAAPVVLHALH